MEERAGSELERKLGLFPLTNIVIANMVGSGIFTTSGLLMEDLGDPLVMLALWVVGGIIALCGALAYGELGIAIPQAGGEYVFLSKLYHPLLGFLSGWTSFIAGFSAPIAASAIGFSEYFFRACPQLTLWGDPAIVKQILSVGVILVFTGIHMRGIEVSARIQNVLTGLKVSLIVCVIVGGLVLGSGSISHFSQGSAFSFSFGGCKTLGLSLMWIMFAYSGWNASTYIGSEIRNPTRDLPRSLLLGTGVVMVLYLCLSIVFVYAVPPEEMKGVISIGGLAMGKLFGPSAETVFSLLISVALFSSLSAFIILGPRVCYSMAKDGLFFKGLARVHPRFKVPTRSIALQGAVSSIMVFSGTFDQILTFMGFALGIFPLFAVAGVFRLRSSGTTSTMFSGYPWAMLIYLVTGVAILVLSFFQRPIESSIAGLSVLVGVPVYVGFKRMVSVQP
ncbi:MAG: amino acid permease [Thermodesulfobacteriota bacterium]